MLIRVVVENLFSFGEQRSFDLVPAPRHRRLEHHKYKLGGLEVLKLSALYGANGAGKSNLVKAIQFLKELVTQDEIPVSLHRQRFKFSTPNDPILLGMDFYCKGTIYSYAIQLDALRVRTEELYIHDAKKDTNQLLFSRITDEEGKTKLDLGAFFKDTLENKVMQKVLEGSFIKPERPVLKMLAGVRGFGTEAAQDVLEWFEHQLVVVLPNSKPAALAHRMDASADFSAYANDIMCAFHTGIERIEVERKTLKEFFGEDNPQDLDAAVNKLNKTANGVLLLRSRSGEEIVLVREENEVIVKRLRLIHKGADGRSQAFYLNEESDGTIKLLDYIPAFRELMVSDKVFVFDEAERSIHPLMIKELVSQFSKNVNSKGQLIFTTHESNLLDQEIFRQDEIWLVEKDRNGATDLYPLSEFKEHHTKDIRKGYLNGRYGGIPFLGNLKDLNWDKYSDNAASSDNLNIERYGTAE